MILLVLFILTAVLIIVTFTDVAQEQKLALGRFLLRLIGWKPQSQRVYEQLQRLSPDWPHISDEAIAAIESLSDAVVASKITLGAEHQDLRDLLRYQPPPDTDLIHPIMGWQESPQPQPEYEAMLPAPADWKPEA